MVFGKWFSEHQPISFIAEFKYVKSFPDEKSAKAANSKKRTTTKKVESKKMIFTARAVSTLTS